MAGEVDRFKGGFFDRGAIITAMSVAERKAMMRTGGYLRKVARNSMRKKKGPAKPGEPPHVHVGHIKNLLFFAYDTQTGSLVVGPVGFNGSPVPNILEFGNNKQEARQFMKPAQVKSQDKLAPSIKFGGTS